MSMTLKKIDDYQCIQAESKKSGKISVNMNKKYACRIWKMNKFQTLIVENIIVYSTTWEMFFFIKKISLIQSKSP